MGLYKVYDKFRRYWRQIHMLTIRDGWKKMAYIKSTECLARWVKIVISSRIYCPQNRFWSIFMTMWQFRQA